MFSILLTEFVLFAQYPRVPSPPTSLFYILREHVLLSVRRPIMPLSPPLLLLPSSPSSLSTSPSASLPELSNGAAKMSLGRDDERDCNLNGVT